MPTYQYACTACDERLEAVQTFTDAPLTECPACGGSLRKVFSAVGVVFKGSGFYKTDSRDSGKKAAAKGDGDGGKSDSGKGDSSKSDSGKGEGSKGDSGKGDSGKSAPAAASSSGSGGASGASSTAARSSASSSSSAPVGKTA